jgi:nucleoside-diphosphate-sugar epimerase
LFQTTGTSNLGDQPITGKYHESRIFSDNDNIYSYLKDREAKQVYAQRTTDLVAIDTGLAAKVPTTLLMSPTIYGIGSGLFNKLSIQVPTVIRAGLKYGQVDIIGEGNGVWDYVHISDLTKLYEIVLNRVLNGEKVPTGEKGILFTGTGRFQWKDLSKGVADALYEIGAVKKSEVKKVTLDEAAPRLSGGLELHAELGYASK